MKRIKKKVIIDTDMGWDDVLSILYLIKNPDVEIMGITVTGCGETDLRWGIIIAKTLMELGKQTEASVCVGSGTPLMYNHTFPRLFKNDMNDIMGLLGSINPDIKIDIHPKPAWDFIFDELTQAEDGSITILSLGGFTNLAKMLKQYSTIPIKKIKDVFAMAGAVYVDGNVAQLNNVRPEWNQGVIYSSNHYAEWNVFIDPLSAKIVFNSELPLTLIPLDACNYVLLNHDFIDEIYENDEIAILAKNILIKKMGDYNEGFPVPIFDPLAAVIMAGGIENYQVNDEFLDVNTDENEIDNHCGETVITRSGTRKIRIVQGVSQHEFASNFIKILNSSIR